MTRTGSKPEEGSALWNYRLYKGCPFRTSEHYSCFAKPCLFDVVPTTRVCVFGHSDAWFLQLCSGGPRRGPGATACPLSKRAANNNGRYFALQSRTAHQNTFNITVSTVRTGNNNGRYFALQSRLHQNIFNITDSTVMYGVNQRKGATA